MLLFLCLLGLAVAEFQESASTQLATTSKTLPPSPTNSGSCHLHGDHWHCHATSSASFGAASARPYDSHVDFFVFRATCRHKPVKLSGRGFGSSASSASPVPTHATDFSIRPAPPNVVVFAMASLVAAVFCSALSV